MQRTRLELRFRVPQDTHWRELSLGMVIRNRDPSRCVRIILFRVFESCVGFKQSGAGIGCICDSTAPDGALRVRLEIEPCHGAEVALSAFESGV